MDNSTILYQHCPCCKSESVSKQLVVKDYTVSNDFFQVWHCQNCTVRFTQHVPNQEEIGKYYQSQNYVSHSDTQEGLINKLYHLVRNITIQSKRKVIQKYTRLKNGYLLDIGAGTGAFANEMKQHFWQVSGLEPDKTARNVAFEKYKIYLQEPIGLYDLFTDAYDAITMWHVLEHVHDLHGYFKEFHRILQQNGRVFIAVPNYTSNDANYYKEFWAAYDVPRHLYHFSPKSMEMLAEFHGFKVEKKLPMWFDSFYVSMLSEQYKHGRNNFIGAIYQGVLSNFQTLFNVEKCSSVIYILRKK